MPSPDRKLAFLWASNFVAALAVLLAVKYALVFDNIWGAEGFAPAGVLLPKSLLFLGHDVLGAAIIATLVLLLALPWRLGRGPYREWPVRVTSLVVQLANGFLALSSFFATRYAGGPLNKATLDLALLAQPVSGVPGSTPAMWSSVQHYLDPFNLSILFGILAWSGIAAWFAPRVVAAMGRRVRRTLLVVCPTLAAVSLALLPFLINGHIADIRVHTYGLEKSPLVELGWSYLRPALMRTARAKVTGDAFRMSLASPFPEEAVGANPLAAARPQRTNVVLVTLESISAGYVEERPESMPFLSSIGKTPGGVALPRHYSTWPQTMKAFFSIACGELPYPSYLPITMVNPAIPCRSLSEVLHDAGYFTAFLTGADLAYDRKLRFFRHRKIDLFRDMSDMPGREGVWGNSWGIDERLVVRNILDVMEEHRGTPTFVWYEMAVAHHPYHCSAEHEAQPLDSDRERYFRALSFIDDRLRELVEGVAARGLGPTLFVFVSDHGEGFGQHPGSKSHGPKVYDENVRVATAMLGPQLADVAGAVGLTTSHVDIAPTILQLVGLPVPCTMKGRALATNATPQVAFFAGRPPNDQYGLADGRWKYMIEDNGMELLFDLVADPGETNSLVAGEPERAKVYRQLVEQYRAFYEVLIEDYAALLADSECRP